jgi:hypothetical protein
MRTPSTPIRLTLLALALAVAACGDNLQVAPDAAVDAAPPPFAEAPHPGVPLSTSHGGPVMAAPVVVPIFFAGDPTMQTQVEGFLAALSTSSYWHATTHEYGVGALTVAPTIVTTDTPPTTDAALKTWLKAQTDGTHAGWPAPSPDTLYAVFLPAGVSLSVTWGTVTDQSCVDFGGYHDEVSGTPIIYALMPRCLDQIDSISQVTSHELIEATTDPHPFTATAFGYTDNDHLGMSLAPGGELGDMCEYIRASSQRLVGNYMVQRTWSNAAAKAGHDPCVPSDGTPYVAAAPVLADDVMIDLGDGTPPTPTKGVSVPVGTSKTIDVALYSDAAIADWEVAPFDFASTLGGDPTELTLTINPATGNNGGKLQLSIYRNRNGGASPRSVTTTGSMFLLSSRVGGHTVSQAWGYVAN